MSNVLDLTDRLKQKEDKESQLAELILASQLHVTAQYECWASWDRLKTAIENYTGEHWSRWKI